MIIFVYKMAILLQASLNESPVTATDSAKWTKVDPVLARVARYVSQGWPIKSELEALDFFHVQDQLSLHCSCLLRGCRVVATSAGKKLLL